MQSGPSILLTQLLGQAPMLLVYLAAIVLAIVFRDRSPLASSLVIAGAVMHVLVAVGSAVVIQSVLAGSNPGQRLSQWSFLGQALHAVAHALILTAAFVDRGPQRASAFEVRVASIAPPAPLKSSTVE